MAKGNPDRANTTAKISNGTPGAMKSNSDPTQRAAVPASEEQEFFLAESGRRLFGEGSYAEGGSNEEGNFESRDTNPHGGYGSFTDAGGYGATELLGEHESHASSVPGDEKAEERTESESKR